MKPFFHNAAVVSAIVIVMLLYWFVVIYYPRIYLPITNIPTRIVFWMVLGIGSVTIVSLLFFQRLLYLKRKEIVLSVLALTVSVISIEALLRVMDRRPLRFAPHQYLNYIGSPNYRSQDGLNMHNSLGFRGPEILIPKPPGRYRIAVIGGSSVYEDLVKDWRHDFARTLEHALREQLPDQEIEVINAGLAAWDSWEDLINVAFRLLDLEIDLLIIYEGTNDVRARFVRPDAYKGDNSGSKKQWDRRLCLDIRCFKIGQWVTGVDDFTFDIDAPTAAPYPEANKYNPILGMTPMEVLERNPPLYFERNLRNMIAIARENGMDVLLSTWAWSDRLGDYAASDHYQRGFADHNSVVMRVGTLKHVPVYDFAAEIPKDAIYWADGRHNNEEGVALKGKLFATYIVKNDIIRSGKTP